MNPVQDSLRLISPSIDFKDAFLSMVDEYEEAGEKRYLSIKERITTDFEGYVHELEAFSRSHSLLEGRVPQTTFWTVGQHGEIIGTTRLRHWLTPELEHEFGHIGYDIRPLQRDKGFGTLQLKLLLEKACELGFERVLITCDSRNKSSARVIEKNGGILENIVLSASSDERVARYWILLHK